MQSVLYYSSGWTVEIVQPSFYAGWFVYGVIMNHMLPIGYIIASLNQSMTHHGVMMSHLVADWLQCSVVYAFHDSSRSRLVDIKYPIEMHAAELVTSYTLR